jgi:hypothetical protein
MRSNQEAILGTEESLKEIKWGEWVCFSLSLQSPR